jgi:hypothetical protein
VLDSEIEPITCVLFVLIVFLIVPFTMLSPFRYPEPSALDKVLAINVGSGAQSAYRTTGETRLGGVRVIDLSAVAAAEQSVPPEISSSVTR